MEKIKQLLQKCGLSDEVSAQICEAFESHARQLNEENETKFQQRLAKAKKVCFEEVEAHKAELSRRLQVFLEAKNSGINEQILRQSAKVETESVAKLERISALLEGVKLDGQAPSELKAELGKLKKLTERLVEERDRAVRKAKSVVQISERVLKRNRKLEHALSEGTTRRPTQTGRIDGLRSNSQRQTTQRTLRESVDRRPPAQPQPQTRTMDAPRTPSEIAATMDEIV